VGREAPPPWHPPLPERADDEQEGSPGGDSSAVDSGLSEEEQGDSDSVKQGGSDRAGGDNEEEGEGPRGWAAKEAPPRHWRRRGAGARARVRVRGATLVPLSCQVRGAAWGTAPAGCPA